MNHCTPEKKNLLSIVLLLSLSAILAFPALAGADTTQTAVIATVASDYSSGAVSIVDVNPEGGPRSYENELNAAGSDIIVAAYENYYYLIQRGGGDWVAKYDITAPDTAIYQYSVGDEDSSEIGNVWDMLFVSSEKAYLLRYGKNVAWIVNPSAETEADFKIGEIDLSDYDDGDGAPEMAAGVLVDGKLFIAMQRLDGWTASNTAYVAVIDTDTDTEIDTDMATADEVKGIPLTIRNPMNIDYCSDNDTLYIQGVGDYNAGTYPGGIETINPSTYATSVLVDETAAGSAISGMAILSADKGYFIGYAGWGNQSLYEFSPTAGTVSESAVNDDLSGISIGGMRSGAYLDQNDMLWVCDQTNAQVVIVDTSDNSIDESVGTSLNPDSIAFTTEGEAGDGSSGDGGSGCFVGTILTDLF